MYVDESGSKVVIVSLLYKPEEMDIGQEASKEREKVPFGCLVAEQIGDELAPTDMHARTEVVSRHAATALWNAQEHHKIFLKPVLKALGSPWRMFRGRTLAKIVAVAAALVLVVVAMAFIPCTLTIEGHGSLLPEERHKIYAPQPGVVAEVNVDHNEIVHTGQILARIESKELDKELKGLAADENKATNQMRSYELQAQKTNTAQNQVDYIQLQTQIAEARITARSARERIEIIQEQLEALKIRSPQEGIITTWEAKKNLIGRPVDFGTELLQVASLTGEWILEVEVPDDDMGPILLARSKLEEDIKAGRKPPGTPLAATFIPMTGPEHLYKGYIRKIAPSAETMAESEQYKNRHVVKITIGFDESVRQDYLKRNQSDVMRPGAEVRARIICGPTNLAYYLLRKPIQVIYESVLFRWPFID